MTSSACSSPSTAPPPRPQRTGRRRRSAVAVGGALAALALAATACSGGSSGPGVAAIGTTTTTASSGSDASASSGNSQADAVAFASCMRSHGVTDFPDPDSSGNFDLSSGDGVDPQSSQFQHAQNACQKDLPNGGRPTAAQIAEIQAQALKFSQCMRAHGITDFPDPTIKGGGIQLSLNGGADSDLNPNSPLFEKAQKECRSDMPKPPKGSGAIKSTAGGPPPGGPNTSGGGNSSGVVAP